MKPILIVEDETVMRESLRDWLTDSGYQVETAEDGEEASKTIAEQDFGLLILDLRLPGKDGVEVLREARAKSPQLKGVIITAYPSVETAVEAMKEGAIDYLPKPFELNQLEKLIQETLGPVQVEIRPRVIAEEIVAEPTVVEEAKVEEVIPLAPEEIPVQLRQISDKSALIQMLLTLQSENHWLSKDTLMWVSDRLGVPLTQIYHTSTFYKAFSLVPKGRHSVSVCLGTACHVRGAPRLLDKVIETLKVRPGGTTRDMRFTLNTVNCLGCCALGPVMVVDGQYYSKPSTKEIEQVAAACE